MKTLLILVLLLLLVGGAWLSRPSEQSFRDYLTANSSGGVEGIIRQRVDDYLADSFGLGATTYHNRFVYATITRDGKVEYVGAFGRWFRWAEGDLTISAGS